MSAVIYGANSALIRSEGKDMSIINGLRVNGNRFEGEYACSPVFEVVRGELSLIDVIIKNMLLFGNIIDNHYENKEKINLKGLIEMKENA